MSDFPSQLIAPPGGVVSTASLACPCSDGIIIASGAFGASAAWPNNNLALYIPFMVETTVTAYQMAFEVTVQAGNYDVGLYDELGNRLVSKGSTAVPVAGMCLTDITDTALTPGLYYMAMNVSTVVTFTMPRSSNITALNLRVYGMQQQAVGATPLPDPATMVGNTGTFFPLLSVALKSTI